MPANELVDSGLELFDPVCMLEGSVFFMIPQDVFSRRLQAGTERSYEARKKKVEF